MFEILTVPSTNIEREFLKKMVISNESKNSNSAGISKKLNIS